MQKKVSAAFCGAGNIAPGNHVPALEARKDRFSIAGFYGISPWNANKTSGGEYRVYKSYEELLTDENIQLVIIATKLLETHYPSAKKALEAGKHVLLEKPMEKTTQECEELIKLAEKKKLPFTVYHNRRLNLDFPALEDVLRSGRTGIPVLTENRVAGSECGGGGFVDRGIRLVDQSMILNDSPLKEVSANFCSPAGAASDSGYGEASLRFEKLPAVRISKMPRRKEFLDYLYESIIEGAPLLAKPHEARGAVCCIELIKKSAAENRTVAAEKMLN